MFVGLGSWVSRFCCRRWLTKILDPWEEDFVGCTDRTGGLFRLKWSFCSWWKFLHSFGTICKKNYTRLWVLAPLNLTVSNWKLRDSGSSRASKISSLWGETNFIGNSEIKEDFKGWINVIIRVSARFHNTENALMGRIYFLPWIRNIQCPSFPDRKGEIWITEPTISKKRLLSVEANTSPYWWSLSRQEDLIIPHLFMICLLYKDSPLFFSMKRREDTIYKCVKVIIVACKLCCGTRDDSVKIWFLSTFLVFWWLLCCTLLKQSATCIALSRAHLLKS